jgi:hypothetical protein
MLNDELLQADVQTETTELETAGSTVDLSSTQTTQPENQEIAEEKLPESSANQKLKQLQEKFACVSVLNTKEGTELYLFSQTKVAHPTFVSTLKEMITEKKDVGNNHILVGKSLEEILNNLPSGI